MNTLTPVNQAAIDAVQRLVNDGKAFYDSVIHVARQRGMAPQALEAAIPKAAA